MNGEFHLTYELKYAVYVCMRVYYDCMISIYQYLTSCVLQLEFLKAVENK